MVETFAAHQLVVVARLDDAAASAAHDQVNIANGAQAVRNDDCGAAEFGPIERPLHHPLAGVVESARRLVQQQYARIAEESARDRNALLLAAGQLHAALAHLGLVAVGEVDDELVRVGHLGRLLDFGVARLQFAHANVFPFCFGFGVLSFDDISYN